MLTGLGTQIRAFGEVVGDDGGAGLYWDVAVGAAPGGELLPVLLVVAGSRGGVALFEGGDDASFGCGGEDGAVDSSGLLAATGVDVERMVSPSMCSVVTTVLQSGGAC